MESTPDKRIRRDQPEPSAPGWLGLFFGETDSRRLIVAFAFAIALVAITVQFYIALLDRGPQPEEVLAKSVVLTITKKPKPTPSPTPKPTPTPAPVHPRVLAQVVDPGKSARKEIVHKPAASRPKVVTKFHSKPIVSVPVGGQGAGAGRKGKVGSLGAGGNGTGAGNAGNGSGGACGVIDFADPSAASFDASTGLYIYDGIEMTVHYADGHAETATLDYPWHYRNPAMDPFKHPDAPILFQFPPKSMRASEPALVQYVMQHEDAMGDITLTACPNTPP